jgi:hypothetical protein
MSEASNRDSVHAGMLIARVGLIVVQLIAVLYFGQQGTLFFYQFF